MNEELYPLDDDEIVYRRVSSSANPPEMDMASRNLSPQAFSPSKRDLTGFSMWRAKYKSAEVVGQGQAGKTYFVAALRVGDLRNAGIDIKVKSETPIGFDIAHVELPEMNTASRRDSVTLQRQRELCTMVCQVFGPFSQSSE